MPQAFVTHILPLATIRRERLLPVPGRVVARRGQQVNPSDVVAEANLSPEHLLLDVARGLGVPVKKADKYLKCKAGDEVGEGEMLAGPAGMGRRVVAPKAGLVIVAGDGQILLQLESQPYELRAGYSGVVADLIADRGVVIEATGALIQGVWGNGRVNYGLLQPLGKGPDETVDAKLMDVSMRGSVILGGYCDDPQVFKTAEDLPVRGMILASMDSSLIPAAMKTSFPIVLVEGFGKLAMNPLAHKLFSSSERGEAALNADAWNSYANARPEIMLSAPAQTVANMPSDTSAYATGKQVRVAAPPYKARTGTITGVRDEPVILPSGIRSEAADVRLENGETILLPLANLEVLE